MNQDFPPLRLKKPDVNKRRKGNGRLVPIAPEILARRQQIAQQLSAQIRPISESIKSLSSEERKAIFLKIKHEGKLPVTGTDLKLMSEPSENFTLAVPTATDLEKLLGKLDQFGTGNLKKGRAPNETLGANLIEIVPGGPFDRVSEALLDKYDTLIASPWIIIEIEIQSLARGPKQQRAELQKIRSEIERTLTGSSNGVIFEQEEIKATCRLVMRCSGALLKGFVEGKEWQTKIVWFDDRPEFETFTETFHDFNVQSLGEFQQPEDDAPVVCVIDSGITEGNPFLSPIVKRDMLKSFLKEAPNNPNDEYGHGSGVASLVSYYSLNLAAGASNQGKVWVASARILDGNNQGDERLFSNVLQEIVDTFAPLGVRVFNLSVGIRNRQWNKEAKRTSPRKSWVARKIDQLSRAKDVVFVVSTGNLLLADVRHYLNDGKTYPKFIMDDESRLLDPAQAALAVSVGSIAPTTLLHGPAGSAIAIAKENHPSPLTRSGPGIKGEIKPELVEFGGNYAFDPEGDIVRQNPGLNVMMASNRLTPAINHDSGTSYAAARVSYKLARIFDDLEKLGISGVSAPLAKAFLINSSLYRGNESDVAEIKQALRIDRNRDWLSVMGYGMPSDIRSTYCDDYSAAMFFQGELQPDEVAFFEVPIPATLSSSTNGKRLTVTAAFDPQVQRWGLEQYFGTSFKWRLFKGNIDRAAIVTAMSEDEESTTQTTELSNEVKNFAVGVTLRSRGTMQHDVAEWKHHAAGNSTNHYTLAVATSNIWKTKQAPIPYGVVVRLEDLGQSVPIYSEIQTALQVRVRT